LEKKKGKILLVEDDKIDRMAFERLARNGKLPYDYVIVGSVTEAKIILRKEKFKAVLMDYMLGDGTAFDLFDKVSKVPFIIVTGAGDEEIAVQAMKAGAHDYIMKDIEGNYLKTLPLTVENAIRRKRAEEELVRYRSQLEELVKKRTAELNAQVIESEQLQKVQHYRLNFEKIISDLSVKFINMPLNKFDQGIITALKAISEFAGAIQGTIFFFSDDLTKVYKSYEWSAEPREPQTAQLQSISPDKLGYFWELLKRLQTVILRHPKDIPSEAQNEREWFKKYGFRPLIFVPLLREQALCGIWGFYGNIGEEKEWSDEFASFLKVKADFIVNAFERKQVEQEQQQNDDRFGGGFMAAKDSIFVKDVNFRYTYVNQAMEQFFGRSATELMGHTDEELVGSKTGAHIKEVDTRVLNGEVMEEEYIKQVKGMPATFHVIKTPMRDKNGKINGLFGIARNVTEHRRVEQETRKLNEDLKKRLNEAVSDFESVNKELKEFAYIVSHDFKAPLRAVNQLTHWISQDYSELFDDEGKEQMNLLFGRIKRMDHLLDGILQYSRIGRIKGKEEQLDLNILISEVLTVISPPDNIRITSNSKLPVIIGNRTRVKQIFQHLLGNAVKFMDKPEGIIRIGHLDVGKFWRFSVSDNGPGVDKKYHKKIFQIFQSLSPRDVQENIGIGLTLVKKIVEVNGGEIWMESKVGQGSTFYFTLPKKEEKNQE